MRYFIAVMVITFAAASHGWAFNVDYFDGGSLFQNDLHGISFAVGEDANNDGLNNDLIVTRSRDFEDGRIVLHTRNAQGQWDSGHLLLNDHGGANSYPYGIVAPIKNDGQNYVVYHNEGQGNGSGSFAAIRVQGTSRVEGPFNVQGGGGWPYSNYPVWGDADHDGNNEIYNIRHGGYDLYQIEWTGSSFSSTKLTDTASRGPAQRPILGNYRNNNLDSLVFRDELKTLSHVYFENNVWHHDNIFTSSGHSIGRFGSGEFDGLPGEDIAFIDWYSDTGTARVMLISGDGTFNAVELTTFDQGTYNLFAADTNGNGLDELYFTTADNYIRRYELGAGWEILVDDMTDYRWGDTTAMVMQGHDRESIFFAGRRSDNKAYRIVEITDDQAAPAIPAPLAVVIGGVIMLMNLKQRKGGHS